MTKYEVWHYYTANDPICHACYQRHLRRRKKAGLPPTGRTIYRERMVNMNKRIIRERKLDEDKLIDAYVNA